MNRSLRKLYKFIKPYRLKFYGALFFSIVYTLSMTSQPLFIGLAISELARNIGAGASTGVLQVNFSYIGKIVRILIATGLISALGDYLANYLLAEAVQDTVFDIRRTMYEKINKLAISYFDSRKQGEILSRVTSDVTVLSEAMQQSLLRVLGAILSLGFSIGFMFFLSPFFTSLSLVIYPICIFLFKKIAKISQPHFKDLQASLGDLNAYIQEYYSGYMVVQLFNREEKAIEGFEDLNEELNRSGFKANFISGTINPLLGFITHLGYILLFLVMALTVLNKPLIIFGIVLSSTMEIGSIQAFIQYIWQSSEPIGQITQLSNLFQSAMASLNRVMEFLDEEEEIKIEEAIDLSGLELEGNIKFEGVKFGYKEGSLLNKNLNIDVKSGDTVAIVGPTGAGKTSLINLLMRFYDIDGGRISIDGIDVSSLSKRQSRSVFGMVDQNPWLYSTTIEENLRFGKLDASYEEVIESAKLANVDHFIRTLPEGYKTLINEDTTNISQGEKQLMTIARALLKDPEILILDEATSSVDTRIEQLIQKAMDQVMEGRTSFIIAHRLSTIRNADLILVMVNGDILEQGSHLELMAKEGLYKELYESQFN